MILPADLDLTLHVTRCLPAPPPAESKYMVLLGTRLLTYN